MLNKSRRSGNAGRVNGVMPPQATPMQLLDGYTQLSYTSRRLRLEGSRRGDLKSICNRFLRISSFESVDDLAAVRVFFRLGYDSLNPSVCFCQRPFSSAGHSVVLLVSSYRSHHLLVHHSRIGFGMRFIVKITARATCASR